MRSHLGRVQPDGPEEDGSIANLPRVLHRAHHVVVCAARVRDGVLRQRDCVENEPRDGRAVSASKGEGGEAMAMVTMVRQR